MIVQERRTNLIEDMRTRMFKYRQSPDDAFNEVADRECISGKDRKKLREAWKNSVFFKQWAEENPDLVEHLVW